MIYKVLWCDDQIEEFEGLLETAYSNYGILMDACTTWNKAYEKLKANFAEYSAIILDWKGKISENCNDSETFLNKAISDLNHLFGEKHDEIPWYVLTMGAGHVSNMEQLKSVMLFERDDPNHKWGQCLYAKTQGEYEKLFTQILQVSPLRSVNKVRALYSDVFEELSNSERWNKKASSILLEILKAYHFPEESLGFEPILHYNQLRQLIEYIFRAYNQIGIIPNELIETESRGIKRGLNIAECSLLLSGKETKYIYEGYKFKHRQPIHSTTLSDWLWKIINVGNENSHTQEFTILSQEEQQQLEQAFDESNMKYQIFIYALQLSEMIRALHQFAVYHPSADDNAKLIIPLEVDANKPTPITAIVEYTDGVYHAGLYLLNPGVARNYVGMKVVLFDITDNTQSNKNTYPKFAKCKLPE